jgi:hypothetical protein
MEIYNTAKKQLKYARWIGRRLSVSLRWGAGTLDQMPVVFGNAIPKSGSHLITQVLHGLPHIGPFVINGFPPVNRAETNEKLSQEATTANLKSMRPGDIGYGYLGCEEPYLSQLTSKNWATVFIHRDPRDVIVSSVFYITEINKSHALHAYYRDRLNNMGERIAAEIHGITESGFEYSGVNKRFEKYIGWLDQPSVLSLRFEDLILERENTLDRLLGYLETRGAHFSLPRLQAIAKIQSGMHSSRSGTFRKGQPGNWKEHFSEANKKTFKEVTGDLLIRLGYEQDANW